MKTRKSEAASQWQGLLVDDVHKVTMAVRRKDNGQYQEESRLQKCRIDESFFAGGKNADVRGVGNKEWATDLLTSAKRSWSHG